MTTSDQSEEDDSYDEFVEACAKECSCCRMCAQVPCAGTMAGGLCDRMCFCFEHEWEIRCDDEYADDDDDDE